jgi:hypothetical protein
MARSLPEILDALATDLHDLRATLSPVLAIATGQPAPARRTRTVRRKRSRTPRPVTSSKGTRRVVRKRVSAKIRAQRIRQGRYLAAVRPLSKENRAKVKQVQATKGYPAAMALAKKLKN